MVAGDFDFCCSPAPANGLAGSVLFGGSLKGIARSTVCSYTSKGVVWCNRRWTMVVAYFAPVRGVMDFGRLAGPEITIPQVNVNM